MKLSKSKRRTAAQEIARLDRFIMDLEDEKKRFRKKDRQGADAHFRLYHDTLMTRLDERLAKARLELKTLQLQNDL